MHTDTPKISWEWEFAWPFPLLPSLIIIAVALSLLFYSYHRLHRGKVSSIGWLALRLAAGLVILVAICRPGWQSYELRPPRVMMLIDDSQSMSWEDELSTDPPATPIDRWAQVHALLSQSPTPLLARVRPDWRVQVELLSGAQVASEDDASADEAIWNAGPNLDKTPLGDRLLDLLSQARGDLPRAIVAWTDGHQNWGRPLAAAAAVAEQLQVPLHFVCLGGHHPIRDARLERLIVDRQAFWGDDVPVRLDLHVHGLTGERLTAEVRHARDGRVLASQSWVANAEETRSMELFVAAEEPGELPLEAVIRTDVAERDKGNNRRTATVLVSDQSLRVRLIATQPSYEYRSLKETLSRQHASARSAIDFSTVLFSADPRIEQIDPRVRSQLTSDWTRGVDCAILCDVEAQEFTVERQQELYQHVSEEGAGVILIAGPQAIPYAYVGQPLARLFPADLGTTAEPAGDLNGLATFQFSPTRLGQSLAAMRLRPHLDASRSTWRQLPSLTWAYELPPLDRGSRVLAVRVPTEPSEATGTARAPLAVLQFVGAGRALFHATDETWRWQIRRGDQEFARYWHQMIRYVSRGRLLGGESVAWNADQPEYTEGETVRLRATFGNEQTVSAAGQRLWARIADASGSAAIELPLRPAALRRGIWGANATELPPGQYVATLSGYSGEPRCEFRVVARQLEREFQPPHGTLLEQAAAQTGGNVFEAGEIEALAAWFQDNQSAEMLPLNFRPLLPPWQIALLVCGFLAIEWIGQRW